MTAKFEDQLREIAGTGSEAPGSSLMVPFAVRMHEAARLLGASRSAIYRLINSGEIEAVKAGANTLIVTESIRRYLANLPRVGANAA